MKMCKPFAELRSAIERDTYGFQRAATRSCLAKCKQARLFQKHARENGNCGQWHGRAEAYITRNHLGGVALGVTPTTQGRVACNATSCRQINKTKGTSLA
jgi:hypothetical protein